MSTVGRNMMKLSGALPEVRAEAVAAPSVPVRVEAESNSPTSDASRQALLQTYSDDDIRKSDVRALKAAFERLPRNEMGLVLLPPTIEGFRAFVRKQREGGRVATFGPSAADVVDQASALGESALGSLEDPFALVKLLRTDSVTGPLAVSDQQDTLRGYLRALPQAEREHAVLNLFAELREQPALLQTLTVETARFFRESGAHFASVVVAEAISIAPEMVFTMEPGAATDVAHALDLGSGTRTKENARNAARRVLDAIADRPLTSASGSAFALELIGVDPDAGLDEAVLFAAARHLSNEHTLVLRETFASPAGRAALATPGVPSTQKLELLACLVELDPASRASLLAAPGPLWEEPAVLRLFAERLFAATANTEAVKPRPMYGAELETSVGVALGLEPERLEDSEAQETLELDMAAGLRSPYRGESKKLTETIAAQIRSAGGEPPEVAVVSVAFMSEHSGVRSIPLFKVKTGSGSFDYVDRQGRRYATLSAFERENPLPPGLLVASDDPQRAVSTTPNGQPLGQALAAVDLVAMGVGTVAGIATLVVPNPVTGGIAVAAHVYAAARSGARLVDRAAHGQSLSDREAAVEWLTVVGGAAGGASPLLRVLAPRTRMATAALRAAVVADGVAFAADGVLTADTAEQLYTRWDDLSAYDRMSLSMQIGFFGVGAVQAGRGLYRTRQVRRALRDAAQSSAQPNQFFGAEGLEAARSGAEFFPGELGRMQSAAEAWLVQQADARPDLYTAAVIEDVQRQIARAQTPNDFASLGGVEPDLDVQSQSIGERFMLDPSTPAWHGKLRGTSFTADIARLHALEQRVEKVLSRLGSTRDASLIRSLETGTRGGVPMKERLHYVREELTYLEDPLPAKVRDELAHLENALRALEALEEPVGPVKAGSHVANAQARRSYDRAISDWKKAARAKGQIVYDSVATVETQLYTLRRIEAGVRTRRITAFPARFGSVVGLKRRSVGAVEAGEMIEAAYSKKVDSLRKRGIDLPESISRTHAALLAATQAVRDVSLPRTHSVEGYRISRAEVGEALEEFRRAVEQLKVELDRLGDLSAVVQRLGGSKKGDAVTYGRSLEKELRGSENMLNGKSRAELTALRSHLEDYDSLLASGATRETIKAARRRVLGSANALIDELGMRYPPKLSGELVSTALRFSRATLADGARANLAIGEVRLAGKTSFFEHQIFVSGERAGVFGESPHSLSGHGRRLHGDALHPGPRDHDSEVQILERVREKLLEPGAPPPHGSLVVFSDRVPCPSCQRLLALFKEQFPGLEVEVRYIAGEEIL